jgi:hypothetical protein
MMETQERTIYAKRNDISDIDSKSAADRRREESKALKMSPLYDLEALKMYLHTVLVADSEIFFL